MRTILLNNGVALLQAQAADSGHYLQVTGFQVGTRTATQTQMENWDQSGNEPLLNQMTGAILLVADDTYVRYDRISPNSGQLGLFIPESVPQIDFGNVVLEVTLATSHPAPGSAFLFSALAQDFTKLQTTQNSPGYGWWFHLLLEIPNLESRFDFSNLTKRTPDWLVADDQWDLPIPSSVENDQLMITAHSANGRPQPLLNIRNRYYGCPLMQPHNATKTRFALSGGTKGDNYQ